jgi:monooxygenase
MRTARGEHLDVLVIGAGLSGIGAGCRLARSCPDLSYAILEARAETGGTWDLFRYPGIRADSDTQTLGYSFAPFDGEQTLAEGSAILSYIRDTAARHGVTGHVRCNHRALDARWDAALARWTVRILRADTGEELSLTCDFLLACTGYYRYDHGYTPRLPGIERFAGPVVHPQQWPDDLDCSGRRVVVIGSGATAVTLVPALADRAAHVTMLQRSPSYVLSIPSRDGLAELAHRWLAPSAAFRAVRVKNVALMTLSYQLCRRRPRLARAILRRGAASQLPAGFDVDTHFNPGYEPWDQRLCVCPDGDLFTALRSGRASIVTDEIRTVTERGLELRGGGRLDADVIVTATGLAMQALGGMGLTVDGRDVKLSDAIAYKAMMLGGVPNFAFTMGYPNATWTLKADLTSEYVCRLLRHMRRRGYRVCVPEPEAGMVRRPLISLASGYVQRSIDAFPAQGSKRPWRLRDSYALDALDVKLRRVDDGVMRFARGDGGLVGVPAASGATAAAGAR